jgi:hypothetical protein
MVGTTHRVIVVNLRRKLNERVVDGRGVWCKRCLAVGLSMDGHREPQVVLVCLRSHTRSRGIVTWRGREHCKGAACFNQRLHRQVALGIGTLLMLVWSIIGNSLPGAVPLLERALVAHLFRYQLLSATKITSNNE